MTTGFVFTLRAIRSDLSGSSPARASSASTCTATANLLLVGIRPAPSPRTVAVNCN